MRCRYIIIATFAEYVNGRLNLLGGDIDKIFLPEIPGLYPQLIVASRIAMDRDDTRRGHPYSISIVDPDGDLVSEGPPGEFPPREMVPEHIVAHVAMVNGFVGIVFRKEGWHRVVLTVDGAELADAPFKIIPLNQTLHLQEDTTPVWTETTQDEHEAGQAQ